MKSAKWLGCIVAALLVGVGSGNALTTTRSMLPQIVRLSYVQGDVRVSRGQAGEKATGDEWEKAAVDMPIYSGFTLVTGVGGRAEIEFEDASHVYLDENSVLNFTDLSAIDDRRHTELALVSGVMTIEALSAQPGGVIMVRTPANGFWLRSPMKTFVRVNSFLDAMELTPMVDHTKISTPLGPTDASAGEKIVFRAGEKTPTLVPAAANSFAAWDAWVKERSVAHHVAMNAAMKEAGLDEPVPGLMEIAAEGSFFDCAPYGKCWAPKDGWDESGAGDGTPEPAAETAQAFARQASAQALNANAQATPGTQPCSASVRSNCVEEDDFFPCSPVALRHFYERDPMTGKLKLIFSEQNIGPRPYLWGVCHAGSWVRWHRRYVWVAGKHRHHHWGVRWVKVGGKLGYVPVHPRDVKGKPPLNIKHGVYVPTDKKGSAEKFVHVSAPVKTVDSTPKEFAKLIFAPLPRVEAPHMEARQLHETSTAHRGEPVKESHGVLTLDHKTQSFQVSRTEMQGGHEHTVTEPVGGRGGMAMNRGGENNSTHGAPQNNGFNSSYSASFSQPSSGAYSSGPVSSGSSGASISAPSGPSGGPQH